MLPNGRPLFAAGAAAPPAMPPDLACSLFCIFACRLLGWEGLGNNGSSSGTEVTTRSTNAPEIQIVRLLLASLYIITHKLTNNRNGLPFLRLNLYGFRLLSMDQSRPKPIPKSFDIVFIYI